MSSGQLTYKATVPANSRATLYLPTRSAKNVKEGDRPAISADGVTFRGYEKGKATYELVSGSYSFSAPL